MITTPTTPLRESMRQALRIRNVSARTEGTYLSLVARFALFHHRSPAQLGIEHVLAYLFHIRDVLKVSYCIFNQTVCALRFFYLHVMERPDLVVRIPFGQRPKPLPDVVSQAEMLAILEACASFRDRVILTVLYSAGLRLGEVCRLEVRDIDSPRMLLHIRAAKGQRDRYAPLSPITLALLRTWYRKTHPIGLLFPLIKDPLRPINHSTVQRALKTAVRRAGITKRVSPHTLRHSFATHSMEQATAMPVIQRMLGHAHRRTTEIYTHVSPAHACSPLDKIIPSPPGSRK
jgi:integrase/recombinase XerD